MPEWLKEKIRPELVLYVATFAAIGPLLIEKDWLVKSGMAIFLLGTGYLFFRQPRETLGDWEKNWIKIVLLYVAVFFISFLLRPPYTEDGIWRLSAPGLMLLVLVWFSAVVRQRLQWSAVKAVALGIVGWGVVIALWEGWMIRPDFLDTSYKLGTYVSDLGAMGGIIPLGAGLALIAALHERRSKFWWGVALAGLILVLLLKKRTPLVLYGVMLAVWAGWLFVRHGGLAVWHRWLLVSAVGAVLVVGGYLQRDLVKAAYQDYVAAVEEGNYVTSLGLRYRMLQLGIQLIKQRPITGWGPSGYKSEGLWPLLEKEEKNPSARDLIAHFTHLHNQFVMDWVLSGIFGFLSGLLLLFYPVYLAVKNQQDRWGSGVLMAGLGLGIIAVMMFGALFTYTYTTVAIMLTLSSIVAVSAGRQT
ncbi:O-antigen ligase family protein [Candidatus Parcubacteria bacterium]|nr:MAG: O-antigen ligase family protein [Candidatus Parcubacteria bacterium]